jgi:hypothetical protein
MGFFSDYHITAEELDEVVLTNPSLRGFILGYMAEYKLKKQLGKDERYSKLVKYDNHDRKRKGDLNFFYKELECSIEVKSIQTNSLRQKGEEHSATFQCDGSDRRDVILPNHKKVNTTCLLVGEFDLVAIPLFPFIKEWKYAFAKNEDLPRTKSKKYTKDQCEYLLATSVPISWPLKPPFVLDPIPLLDQIVEDRKSKKSN